MQTRIESTSEGARRLDISCESTSLPGVTEPSTRPKPRLALDKPNRPKCPDGHTVDGGFICEMDISEESLL